MCSEVDLKELVHLTKSAAAADEVAVLLLSGALNPVHSEHIQTLELARGHLEQQGVVVLCGFLHPASDEYIEYKMRQAGSELGMSLRDRVEACELSARANAAAHGGQRWLYVSRSGIDEDFIPTGLAVKAIGDAIAMAQSVDSKRPRIRGYTVCGADLIVKYYTQNWHVRQDPGIVVVNRPGVTGLPSNAPAEGWHVVTGEKQPLSSTQVREAVDRGCWDMLEKEGCDPSVVALMRNRHNSGTLFMSGRRKILKKVNGPASTPADRAKALLRLACVQASPGSLQLLDMQGFLSETYRVEGREAQDELCQLCRGVGQRHADAQTCAQCAGVGTKAFVERTFIVKLCFTPNLNFVGQEVKFYNDVAHACGLDREEVLRGHLYSPSVPRCLAAAASEIGNFGGLVLDDCCHGQPHSFTGSLSRGLTAMEVRMALRSLGRCKRLCSNIDSLSHVLGPGTDSFFGFSADELRSGVDANWQIFTQLMQPLVAEHPEWLSDAVRDQLKTRCDQASLMMAAKKFEFGPHGAVGLDHGDCWAPNFIVQKPTEGEILSVVVIDWQFATVGNVLGDVAQLLYSCVDGAGEQEQDCMATFVAAWLDVDEADAQSIASSVLVTEAYSLACWKALLFIVVSLRDWLQHKLEVGDIPRVFARFAAALRRVCSESCAQVRPSHALGAP